MYYILIYNFIKYNFIKFIDFKNSIKTLKCIIHVK